MICHLLSSYSFLLHSLKTSFLRRGIRSKKIEICLIFSSSLLLGPNYQTTNICYRKIGEFVSIFGALIYILYIVWWTIFPSSLITTLLACVTLL